MRRLIVILMATFLGTIGCSNNSNPPTIKAGLIKNQTIEIEDISREYHMFIPDNPASAPVILVLHGNGGSNDQVIGLEGTKAPHKVWLEIAKRENLILVIPNGSLGSNGRHGWNDCRSAVAGNPTTDDVLFLSNLIDHVSSTYQTQTSKVFSVGTSNGGFMTMRLAQEIPEKLSAIGVLVAALPAESECINSTIPLSTLIMNGTDDPLVPYDGGQVASDRGEIFSTEKTIQYWVDRNQTNTSPTITELPNINTRDGSTITKYSYTQGTNNSEVLLYKVNNGGRTEPSLKERYSAIFKLIVGSQNGDIEMAEEVLTFFQKRF